MSLRPNSLLSSMFLIGDYLVVTAAIAAACWLDRCWATALAMIIVGGRQVALLNLTHTAIHGALFSKRRDNDRLQLFFAYPVLESTDTYRGPHLEQHREFARRSADRFAFLHGELRLHERGFFGRTWILFVRPFLGYGTMRFVFGLVRDLRCAPRTAARMVAAWSIAVLAAWPLHALTLFGLYWVVPLLYVYPILNLWAEVADHFQAPDDSRSHVGLFYALLLKPHDPFHALHHRYPGVPFYRLKRLRSHVAARGIRVSTCAGPASFLRGIYG